MKHYSLTISFEESTFQTKTNVQANGKEEAIEKGLERLFKTVDFNHYMRISKVEAVEGV